MICAVCSVRVRVQALTVLVSPAVPNGPLRHVNVFVNNPLVCDHRNVLSRFAGPEHRPSQSIGYCSCFIDWMPVCSTFLQTWYRGRSGRNVKLTTHHHLVPMLRISEPILSPPPPHPPAASYCCMRWHLHLRGDRLL